MALSAFEDRSHPPDDAALQGVLGDAAPLWRELVAHVGEAHGPVTEQWNHAGAKFGWSLRLRRGERVVLYMTPRRGELLVGIVLGEKAAAAARERGLPAPVLALLDAAPKYAEGRGIRIPVRTREDLAAVEVLAAAKLAAS